mgnify:CR=1 FL=1
MKTFNTTGKMIASQHYMAPIDRQVNAAAKLVEANKYFCINRGRQYGKTTTLSFLKKHLEDLGYVVFSISFEGLPDSAYESLEALLYESISLIAMPLKWAGIPNLLEESARQLVKTVDAQTEEMGIMDYRNLIATLCSRNQVALIIDEVDQAGNYPAFIKFLGLLRSMYLSRDQIPTFQSVILAGVYDIKNLKLKLRPEDQHQYNSPWNIAVPFDVDMSLPVTGITEMLAEYKSDHKVDLDEKTIAQLIYDYTSGYPFLVSRLCQIIDDNGYSWDKEGVLAAVNILLKEGNTLFDDMVKKLDQFPNLADTLQNILYSGQRIAYNYYDKDINIASMFNIIYDNAGTVAVRCRIFETWLYNYFATFEKSSSIYRVGEADKSQFVHDGLLDMRHILERFVIHFNEIYHPEKDMKFVEENGRKIFLTYLRPIINGVGNYYCEAQTRDLTKTDVIVDYLGNQYIVELKIWRGNSYNERGEQQLADYLDYYHQEAGYLVSFCFNKTKQIGVREVVVGKKLLYEAVV